MKNKVKATLIVLLTLAIKLFMFILSLLLFIIIMMIVTSVELSILYPLTSDIANSVENITLDPVIMTMMLIANVCSIGVLIGWLFNPVKIYKKMKELNVYKKYNFFTTCTIFSYGFTTEIDLRYMPSEFDEDKMIQEYWPKGAGELTKVNPVIVKPYVIQYIAPTKIVK